MLLAQQIIARKRDGGKLDPAHIEAFAQGLADGGWSDAQAGAMAMAILLRGMDGPETAQLTEAMTRSGEVLDWSAADLPGPVLDKHSTGGVGDKVSLLLAPLVAACGGVVPMISGRGLGHTGGTLDKLEALPGYDVNPARERLNVIVRSVGCAIVGASERLAPADRRLYAIRDVTGTIESLPLITASILSKKRAAGLQALVLDVKFGSGAFMRDAAEAAALADSLVSVARAAGLPSRALVTDMNQVLGRTAGNALEVQEAIDLLTGRAQDVRLIELTLELSALLLHLGGLFDSVERARAAAAAALSSGAAAERFARMVAALGGPADVLRAANLPRAPIVLPVAAPRAGFIDRIDVKALGLAVLALGGGRRRNGDPIDPRVGLAGVAARGAGLAAGEPLAFVHAADMDGAAVARQAVLHAFSIADEAPPAVTWHHATL
jgi:thymidine phosphorylase